MLRRIALTSLIISTLGAVPAIAAAAPGAAPTDSGNVTSHRGLPTGWTYDAIADCPGGALVPGASYRHIPGPSAGGDGALELSVPAGGAAVLTIPVSGASMASVSNLILETQQPASSAGPAMVSYANVIGDLSDASGYHYRLYRVIEPGVTEFHGFDVLGSTMTWAEGPDGAEFLLKANGTYADFLASSYNTEHPAIPRSIEYRLDNCSGTGAQVLYIDDLIVGTDGTDALYSLDAPVPPALTPQVSVSNLIAGKTVTPSVTITDGTTPLAGAQVSLLQRTAGAAKFTTVATVAPDGSGVATTPPLSPKKNTTYQWYFAAADGYAQGFGAASVVHVAPKVSLALKNRAVKSGKPLEINGTVTPKHGGSKIILWRKKGGHDVKLAKTKEKGNGFFAFSKVLPKGHYALFVTSAKTATNVAGTSSTKAFSVTK